MSSLVQNILLWPLRGKLRHSISLFDLVVYELHLSLKYNSKHSWIFHFLGTIILFSPFLEWLDTNWSFLQFPLVRLYINTGCFSWRKWMFYILNSLVNNFCHPSEFFNFSLNIWFLKSRKLECANCSYCLSWLFHLLLLLCKLVIYLFLWKCLRRIDTACENWNTL